MEQEINKYSKRLTQDSSQPAAQAMYHALGFKTEDLTKAQVGIASTGYEGNPCNMHLNLLAQQVKKGVGEKDLIGLVFNTIGVSDGMSMGTPGMRYSLPSRDFAAKFSVETCFHPDPIGLHEAWKHIHSDELEKILGVPKDMPRETG